MRLPLKLTSAALALATFTCSAIDTHAWQLYATQQPLQQAETPNATQPRSEKRPGAPQRRDQARTDQQGNSRTASGRITSEQVSICEAQIQAAARKYGVPEGILYSVGLTETGRRGSLSPYALNIEGKAHFASSVQEAMQLFTQAKSTGAKLIDLGCMQINHHFHGQEFASVPDMLDPRKNVEYAALFLKRLHDKHETWTMAVARYHAGPNNNPAQQRYVCRVIANLVATDFGKWTRNATNFCGPNAT
jgi:soluble lytic murein transglycosylase-like protein